ncbi:amino acid adenylation domain-containing protein [Geomobilimonas luticola]|uniref:Amino acid adenylation domain-containing protein n=1 Tax=Geomobilimonas luticola TaxID=1114878 RepID=A0ABS5SC24_9BACT|nr:amino acid adenylation domain-containing protein [Geomobilimonas luticola]MBT0652928.1 amino acid adenylation domain-containing protein [Geomobilimonas luticola]
MFLLPHLLSATTEKYPDKDAVVLGESTISYAELERKSSQLAFSLVEQGVKRGDRVGMLLKKSIESIISLFGIMKAGAIYVPIDPLAPVARSQYIIQNCGIDCLITSAQGISDLFAVGETVLLPRKSIVVGLNKELSSRQRPGMECIAWEDIGDSKPVNYCQASIADVYPAYILHTSGSTGTPKGVVISHLNALSFVNMVTDFFQISPYDRIASHAPLHFDLSVFDVFGAVRKGATIDLVPEFLSTFPVKLAEFIDRRGISVWNSVSSVLTMLADKGVLERSVFDSLRLVHFSGDIMPAKYLRVLKKHMRNAAFYNIYGQTEANSSMFYRVDDIPADDAWKIPIGRPFPNIEVNVVNERNEVINHPGEDGELQVKSSTVALGYWSDKEKTSDKFVQEPGNSSFRSTVYRTGDIVRADDAGNYLFVGRKDHMIKSRGYRIELSEIELVLTSHPLVRQAVVIAVPDELIGNKIIAYVVQSEGDKMDVHDLSNYCYRFLPKYMVPETFELLSDFPKTSTGKIDRNYFEAKALISTSPTV